jgi:hypothetical protein
MFYVVIGTDGYASWWSGQISFEITMEDVLIMYKEAKKKDLPSGYIVMNVDDMDIANKIMRSKAKYTEGKWEFEEIPILEPQQQTPTVEQLQHQINSLQEQINKLSQT